MNRLIAIVATGLLAVALSACDNTPPKPAAGTTATSMSEDSKDKVDHSNQVQENKMNNGMDTSSPAPAPTAPAPQEQSTSEHNQ